jgi:hypothetical protein
MTRSTRLVIFNFKIDKLMLTLSLPMSQLSDIYAQRQSRIFCDLTWNTEVIGLSDLMTLFTDLVCLYCKQTQRAFNVFKNTLNWLKIDSVDQKLFNIQLTRVWELLTRRWNAWHWERHCVFTAGAERVKKKVAKVWFMDFIPGPCRCGNGALRLEMVQNLVAFEKGKMFQITV